MKDSNTFVEDNDESFTEEYNGNDLGESNVEGNNITMYYDIALTNFNYFL